MDEFDRDICTADLSSRSIGDAHILRLMEPTALHLLQNVKRLDLSQNQIGTDGAQTLATALHKKGSLRALYELRLSRSSRPFGSSGWTLLCDAFKSHPCLHTLDLSGSILRLDDWSLLCETVATGLPALHTVSLDRMIMSDNVHVYNDLIPGRWQSMLALPGTALSDRAAPGLARIVGRASLCGLSIAGNGLTVHTITAMLKAMPAGNCLQFLNLSCNDLFDESAALLADAFHPADAQAYPLFAQIRELRLAACRMTTAGLQAIFEAVASMTHPTQLHTLGKQWDVVHWPARMAERQRMLTSIAKSKGPSSISAISAKNALKQGLNAQVAQRVSVAVALPAKPDEALVEAQRLATERQIAEAEREAAAAAREPELRLRPIVGAPLGLRVIDVSKNELGGPLVVRRLVHALRRCHTIKDFSAASMHNTGTQVPFNQPSNVWLLMLALSAPRHFDDEAACSNADQTAQRELATELNIEPSQISVVAELLSDEEKRLLHAWESTLAFTIKSNAKVDRTQTAAKEKTPFVPVGPCFRPEAINLSHNRLDMESFARIARRIAACMSLQTINLSGNRFGDGGVSLFCRYAFEHRHFAHLELGASDLFEAASASSSDESAKFMQLWASISDQDSQQSEPSARGVKFAADTKQEVKLKRPHREVHQNLRSLDFSGLALHDTSLFTLLHLIEHTLTLSTLRLEGNSFSLEAARAWNALMNKCELVDCVVPGADVLSLDTQAVCNTAPLASPMTPSAKVQDAYTASPLNFRPSPSPLKSMEELRQARLRHHDFIELPKAPAPPTDRIYVPPPADSPIVPVFGQRQMPTVALESTRNDASVKLVDIDEQASVEQSNTNALDLAQKGTRTRLVAAAVVPIIVKPTQVVHELDKAKDKEKIAQRAEDRNAHAVVTKASVVFGSENRYLDTTRTKLPTRTTLVSEAAPVVVEPVVAPPAESAEVAKLKEVHRSMFAAPAQPVATVPVAKVNNALFGKMFASRPSREEEEAAAKAASEKVAAAIQAAAEAARAKAIATSSTTGVIRTRPVQPVRRVVTRSAAVTAALKASAGMSGGPTVANIALREAADLVPTVPDGEFEQVRHATESMYSQAMPHGPMEEAFEALRLKRQSEENQRLRAEQEAREAADRAALWVAQEAARIEAERLEQLRLEEERIELARQEAERLQAERLEAERVEAERLLAEQIAREQAEAEERARLEAEEAAKAMVPSEEELQAITLQLILRRDELLDVRSILVAESDRFEATRTVLTPEEVAETESRLVEMETMIETEEQNLQQECARYGIVLPELVEPIDESAAVDPSAVDSAAVDPAAVEPANAVEPINVESLRVEPTNEVPSLASEPAPANDDALPPPPPQDDVPAAPEADFVPPPPAEEVPPPPPMVELLVPVIQQPLLIAPPPPPLPVVVASPPRRK